MAFSPWRTPSPSAWSAQRLYWLENRRYAATCADLGDLLDPTVRAATFPFAYAITAADGGASALELTDAALAYTLAGDRRLNSFTAITAERARSAVTHRIRGTVRRIAGVHPPLGRHLAVSISTGTYCRYHPEQPVDWTT